MKIKEKKKLNQQALISLCDDIDDETALNTSIGNEYIKWYLDSGATYHMVDDETCVQCEEAVAESN